MDPRPLIFFAEACAGAEWFGGAQTIVQRVCADSRAVQSGDLFVALAGEKFDGHDFVEAAFARGAAAAVIEKRQADRFRRLGGARIVVENTRRALGEMAARYRREFRLPITAVAGSNGKTSAKELAASVLSQRFRTLRSPASFNNEIGVPLTLFELNSRSEAAVLEIGSNHPGELEPLVRILAPQHGLLTSLGGEHLEFFGDLRGVAEEESWLGRGLPSSGKLFVNGDSPEIRRILDESAAPAVTVGFSEKNAWRAHRVLLQEDGLHFEVESPNPIFSRAYHAPLLGRHQAVNATLAIALGHELGLSPDEAARGLRQCPAPARRLQLKSGQGFKILDDCYNANAESVRAALETLRDLPGAHRRSAILGDMAELGLASEQAHAEIGRCAAEAKLHHLWAVGTMASVISQAARQAGLPHVSECGDPLAAAAQAREWLRPGDVILVKASRAARLERVVDALERSAEMRP